VQRSSPDEVYVEVEDRLSGARAYVQHSAITVFDRSLASDLRCRQVASANKFGVFGLRLLQPCNVFLGYDEHVGRPLRVQILEGEGVFIFVHFFAGHFASDNATE